jgi:hypothetical protein
MIYMVDIDNTICYSYDSDYNKSVPLKERIEKINKLFDQGHEIIYWTARGMSSGKDWAEFTLTQLGSWGCRYTKLIMNKPRYDVWIDDKSINSEDFF